MVMRWKIGEGVFIPRAVECPKSGYPHLDAEGDQQFNNTHWDDPKAAWAYARVIAEADVSLTGKDVKHAQERLARAQEEAGKAAVRFSDFLTAERRYLAAAEPPTDGDENA